MLYFSVRLFFYWEGMGNKIHFTSLGCARNLVDTEVMLGIVLKSGYEITPDLHEADFLVINTCAFLESARQEAFANLEEMFSLKKDSAKIVVAGCMVGMHREELKVRFPAIHYFLGSGDVEKIMEAITADNAGEKVGDAKSYLQMGDVPRFVSTPKNYAYLKIAEGCKKRCSYCIIPAIKGKLQSKSVPNVVKEFRSLLNNGAREIILIAQDLGDYGKDRGEKNALLHLLKEILKVEGNYWLRLLYLYPDEITDELIELIESDPRICPYLDMPIQHINDNVLKRMFRTTSREEIESIMGKLRQKIPGVVIRTSLMVGFPGETEEQFEELLAFVKKAKLDNVGIFKYSKESQSHSATLDGHIDDATKEKRFQRLAKAQKQVVDKLNEKYVGKKLKVMIESRHRESDKLLVGRFYGQCPEIDGTVIINDWRNVTELGQFYEVEITDFVGYDLIGRAVKMCEKKKPQLSVLY